MLGSCGAWPEPWRACSGFVLELDGFRVVLDLGYGTLLRLLGHLDSPVADGVDAVVVTHHHPDHAIDLHGLFRAMATVLAVRRPVGTGDPPQQRGGCSCVSGCRGPSAAVDPLLARQ